MKARQLIGRAAYPPHRLRVIYMAFDDAWAEVAPSMDTEPSTVEMARLSLAEIVLSLAKVGPIEGEVLRCAAVSAFRYKHRLK
jgi:hypothetical protein